MTEQTKEAETFPPVLTKDQVNDIAVGIANNEIFTDLHIDPDDGDNIRKIGMIWMPIGLGCLEGRDLSNLGMIYSWVKDAGSRSVNGYPVFMSANFINKEQALVIHGKARELILAREKAEAEILG